MHRLFANRAVLILVALLTLGAYGQRAFAKFLACDCPCCPAEVSMVAVDDGGIATAESGKTLLVPLLAGEHGKGAGSPHDEGVQGCSCLCHAAAFANVQVSAPALAPLRFCAATLHAAPPQCPCEGVRAGIEYPPRAA